MPLINIDLGQDYEDKPVAEGEYSLRVSNFEGKTSKKAQAAGETNPNMYLAMILIEGEEGAGATPIFQNLMLPDGGEYDRWRLRDIKRFLTVFGVAFEANGFEPEDVIGQTGKCLVVQENDEKGNPRNQLKLPKVGS
jgi:hypothetical protein